MRDRIKKVEELWRKWRNCGGDFWSSSTRKTCLGYIFRFTVEEVEELSSIKISNKMDDRA
jgi:hypothetical protein